MMSAPLLEVNGLVKSYFRGLFSKRETFRLEADFTVPSPKVVGMMGPNGSGKTTLFELITGSNQPSAGFVKCLGQNIHDVKYGERDRLAIHYHQSYQVRHFRLTGASSAFVASSVATMASAGLPGASTSERSGRFSRRLGGAAAGLSRKL